MTEKNLFGTGKYQDWVRMFSRLHKYSLSEQVAASFKLLIHYY